MSTKTHEMLGRVLTIPPKYGTLTDTCQDKLCQGPRQFVTVLGPVGVEVVGGGPEAGGVVQGHTKHRIATVAE